PPPRAGERGQPRLACRSTCSHGFGQMMCLASVAVSTSANGACSRQRRVSHPAHGRPGAAPLTATPWRGTMPTTLARFCARHHRGVLAAWILLIMIGMAAAVPLFGHLSYAAGGSSESARGATILSRASSTGQGAVILVQGAPVDAAATRAEVLALTA